MNRCYDGSVRAAFSRTYEAKWATVRMDVLEREGNKTLMRQMTLLCHQNLNRFYCLEFRRTVMTIY